MSDQTRIHWRKKINASTDRSGSMQKVSRRFLFKATSHSDIRSPTPYQVRSSQIVLVCIIQHLRKRIATVCSQFDKQLSLLVIEVSILQNSGEAATKINKTNDKILVT
mmetsp:Transcript_37916/g.92276  ORF Transcript_37916/g.92276 Transcript_37916/m.92276 type:complete len:108 (+) Transcript_37916:85-408(+)